MRSGLVVTAGVALLLCVAGAAGAWATWKPVMPNIRVALKPDGGRAPDLMLIYDEQGGNPLLNKNHMLPSERISSCPTDDLQCAAPHARYEFRNEGPRRQSIQVRRQGHGNPILGGVTWTGTSYPRRVELACDLAVTDARRACRIVRITV
jgi:hypothetical protein